MHARVFYFLNSAGRASAAFGEQFVEADQLLRQRKDAADERLLKPNHFARFRSRKFEIDFS